MYTRKVHNIPVTQVSREVFGKRFQTILDLVEGTCKDALNYRHSPSGVKDLMKELRL